MKSSNNLYSLFHIKVIKLKFLIKDYIDNLKNYINTYVFLVILSCFLSFNIGYTYLVFNNTISSKETLVHFINIGQGDAILIRNRNFSILIDSGSNEYSDYLISYLKKSKISKLNYVIATHPHEDHIGSMDEIVKAFPIDTFIAPKVISPSEDFTNLINALKSKDLKISTVNDNSIISLDSNNFLNILWAGNFNEDNINNNSLVLKYTNENISFLFTGDIEKEVENKLQFFNSSQLASSVLKVPHHGSNSSSTEAFLDYVNPHISVITCGMGNDYGHPHKDTLHKLSSRNSSIFRTDINGNIIIKTDGTKLWIHTEHQN